jgi:hypothetical protein
MPLDPALRAAYERAVYVIYGSPPVEFRIGEQSEVIEAMMLMSRVACAAFISSANARGATTPEGERRLADFILRNQVAGLKYRVYHGEGRDPQGLWNAEPSILVMGIPRAEAEALGRTLEQNAIVFVEKGGAPALVVLV